MAALRWMCVVVVVMVVPSLLTSSSANLLDACRAQCREEEELKAACSDEQNCDSLLPNLSAFVHCVEPCTNLGNNCFQRCAFKTDRIVAICSRQCQVGGAARVTPVPGGGSEGDNLEGALCYKACYDSLLNDAMDRLYTKRP